jgi:protein subunit release factor B
MTRKALFTEQEKELRKKMRHSKLFLKDIKEKFVKSSGKGGQNVNSVSSCVMLHHLPTGLQVKCQEERSQILNRHKAHWLLLKKVEDLKHQKKLKEIQSREKIKRQTRKRPGSLKEEILHNKHAQSDKKKARKNINVRAIEQDL